MALKMATKPKPKASAILLDMLHGNKTNGSPTSSGHLDSHIISADVEYFQQQTNAGHSVTEFLGPTKVVWRKSLDDMAEERARAAASREASADAKDDEDDDKDPLPRLWHPSQGP